MSYCAVYGCKNSSRNSDGIKFFRFPKNEDLQQEWIHCCRRSDKINVKNARICSRHFDEACYYKSLRHQLLQYSPVNSRKLRIDAVPSLLLPKDSVPENTKRTERRTVRARRNLVRDILLEDNSGNRSEKQTSEDVIQSLQPCTSSFENTTLQLPEEIIHQLQVTIKTLESQVAEVLLKNKEIEKAKRSLKEQLQKLKNVHSTQQDSKLEVVLSRFFTPGQIRCILSRKKHIRWSAEDIASAISLRSVSAKAYRYLRNKLKYPLPHISTLRKWAEQFHCDRGILKDVVSLMKAKNRELSDFEKVTVISFDEMKISNQICFDRKKEQVLGPHNYVQVVMVRGLLSNWKQPVYYDFDTPMNKSILNDIILSLENSGYKVVGLVSDMGATNRAVWREFGINEHNTTFPNPSDSNRNIFVFADAPHLLKLVRNHFIDKGFIVKGEEIDKDFVQQLLNKSIYEFKLTPRLTQHHLDVRGSGRQKVKPAVQVFSNSVSNAITYLHEKKVIVGNAQPTAKVLKIFNDWFDVFNSCRPCDAYGTKLEEQNDILNEMSELTEFLRVKGAKHKLPFQIGIQINNKSLQSLFTDLKKTLNIKYITTVKLNQDVLECFFSYIRGMGHQNTHPSPIDFKYRIRNYILGKHSAAVFAERKNTDEKTDEMCLVSEFSSNEMEQGSAYQNESTELLLCKEMHFTNTFQEKSPLNKIDLADMEEIDLDLEDRPLSSDEISLEGLKYVAGYIAHRFRNKYPDLGTTDLNSEDDSWIHVQSKGNLKRPTNEFFELIKNAEMCFDNVHGNNLCKKERIFESLTKMICGTTENKYPEEVINCFVRTRTYMRIKYLNMKYLNEQDQKRKERNKMRKTAL